MKNIVFFDGPQRESLLPLTYLRTTAHCMVGMKTVEAKWMSHFQVPHSYLTATHLSKIFPFKSDSHDQLYINGACLPDETLVDSIKQLGDDEALVSKGFLVSFRLKENEIRSRNDLSKIMDSRRLIETAARIINYPEDILNFGNAEFLSDYMKITKGRDSGKVDSSVRLRGDHIFIGDGVKIFDAIINATAGPVYVDDKAEIMEGAVIKGPAYIGKGTKVHVGSKIYADTYLGPECRVGGEIKRTTMFGYSNKAHDGYLGDSVLGRWCNLGADTNNSNMKNTYGLVSLWDISNDIYRTTKRQFLGMILGDHTMSAINTSFNTGSVTGIFSNILDRSPLRYSPSFSWGKKEKYQVDKAIAVAKIAMSRRSIVMTEGYESAIRYLSSQS